jgi:uncharacterized protein YecE (DUF72 family)
MNASESHARIHVGRASLEGGIGRYARSFDLLEVTAEQGRHPRRAGLLEWRRSVPDAFVFSVVLPQGLASLDAGDAHAALLTHALSVADALAATWWLLRTPPAVTPSARATRKLEALIGELRAGDRRIAWEPRGVWEESAARRTADELGVHLVRDLAREDRVDDAPVVYTRLRALGAGARIGAAAAERVAERLEGVDEALVVVEGAGAGRVRQVLREAFALSDGTASDEDDERDDEDDEPGSAEDRDGDDHDDEDEDDAS